MYVFPFHCFSEDKNQIVKRYVYSGTSGAASLQHFIEHNIYHRQGELTPVPVTNRVRSFVQPGVGPDPFLVQRTPSLQDNHSREDIIVRHCFVFSGHFPTTLYHHFFFLLPFLPPLCTFPLPLRELRDGDHNDNGWTSKRKIEHIETY